MAWKTAKLIEPKENKELEEIENLQPELNKEYMLQIERMGTSEAGKEWIVVTDEENKEFWLPSHKDLREKLKQFEDLAEGDYILIKHVEDVDVGMDYPKKIYDVKWDDGNG